MKYGRKPRTVQLLIRPQGDWQDQLREAGNDESWPRRGLPCATEPCWQAPPGYEGD
jgi:hypothetical protein